MNYMLTLMVLIICLLFVNVTPAQTAAGDNKISKTITFRPIPRGATVLGIFEGRPPCAGLADELKIAIPSDCIKIKCNLVFYRDPETLQPTTYKLTIVGGGDVVKVEGGSYRLKVIQGRWKMVKGIKSNARAVIYQLALDRPGAYLNILEGDKNVLFILDANKQFRVGNEDFSYTLNRVELVPGNK